MEEKNILLERITLLKKVVKKYKIKMTNCAGVRLEESFTSFNGVSIHLTPECFLKLFEGNDCVKTEIVKYSSGERNKKISIINKKENYMLFCLKIVEEEDGNSES